MHGVAAASVLLAVPVPGTIARLLLLWALLLHAWWLRPRCAPALVVDGAGHWALPTMGLKGLGLGVGTCSGERWVALVLAQGTRRMRWLVLEDQLPPSQWMALRDAVRPPGGQGTAQCPR